MVSRATGHLVPRRLWCEHLVNPLGIDAVRPRLSWIVESDRRGEQQTAYQILVAGSEAQLAAGAGDVWDSGKVESGETAEVVYAGTALESRASCHWKVRVWDRDDAVSAWSAPARWTMGLLRPEDWRAQWIGYANVPDRRSVQAEMAQALTFDGCQWLWFPEVTQRYLGDDAAKVAPCTRYFRRTFTLPGEMKIRWAGLVLEVYDEFEVSLNGKPAGRHRRDPDRSVAAWSCDVTRLLAPGRNVLAIEARNTELDLAGVVGKLVVRPEGGAADLVIVTDGFSGGLWDWEPGKVKTPSSWRVADRAHDGWTEAGFDDSAWAAAQPLVDVDHGRGRILPGWRQESPGPLFRKTFELDKPVRSAMVSICGLGYCELRLNGGKVGDAVLDPAFTVYDKRVLYTTYDVTDRLRTGRNTLGVMLGNGWYNMHTRDWWGFNREPWRGRPKLLLELQIVFADGTAETIASDASWQTAAGPVLYDGVHNGEIYDARRERPGWDTPEFVAAGWGRPEPAAPPKGTLRAQTMPPVKVTETLVPVKVTEPNPGVFIFDMGQNFAGWCQLTVAGPAGTKVTLRHGERLAPDGMLDLHTPGGGNLDAYVLQGPFQTDTYILKGGGAEVWEPRFSYHGFRYVEMTGFPGTPTAENLRGRVVHTAFDPAGSFTCSNALFNQIQRMTLWTCRSNFHGYATDCPTREKNGWSGDSHIIAETMLYNFQATAVYEKWMNDFRDAQLESGKIPDMAPPSQWAYERDSGPGWDCTYLFIPWYLYRYCGDRRVLAEHYERFKRYLVYLEGRAEGDLINYGNDDWCPAKTETPVPVTSTLYYYLAVRTVSEAARVLGKAGEAAEYARFAERIRNSFNASFYQGDGIYANGSQAALSGVLYYDMEEPAERKRVLEQLLANIERADWHLDVGFLGNQYLYSALAWNGRNDVACRIATQTTPPSYGDWVRRGATTLWEDWYGLSSLNHFALGSIGAWFYRDLAGLNLDPHEPGFKRFIVRPRPAGDLTWVRAEHQSPHGNIAVSWQIAGGSFTLEVTVPANTTAAIHVPAADAGSVRESGVPATEAEGVRFVRLEDGCAVFEARSGCYRFVSELPPGLPIVPPA